LANPRAAEAEAVRTAIASQPQLDKFAESLKAVAVVLQLRDPIKPTEAERQRDEVFTDAQGWTLAILASKERDLLRGQEAFTQAEAPLAAATSQSKALADLVSKMYQQREEAQRTCSPQSSCCRTLARSSGRSRPRLPASKPRLKGVLQRPGQQLRRIQKSDLTIVVWPYALMGVFLLAFWRSTRGNCRPGSTRRQRPLGLEGTFKRLLKNAGTSKALWRRPLCGRTNHVLDLYYSICRAGARLSKATAKNCNISRWSSS
jgi:hypothetical protein